jgi:hypothetical protein
MRSRPVSGRFVIAAAAIASPHPLGGERALPSSAETYGAERPCCVPLLASVAAIDGPSSATENATLCNFLCPAVHGRQGGKRRKCRAIASNARFTRGFYLASAAEQARYLVIALRKPDRGSLGRPPGETAANGRGDWCVVRDEARVGCCRTAIRTWPPCCHGPVRRPVGPLPRQPDLRRPAGRRRMLDAVIANIDTCRSGQRVGRAVRLCGGQFA